MAARLTQLTDGAHHKITRFEYGPGEAYIVPANHIHPFNVLEPGIVIVFASKHQITRRA